MSAHLALFDLDHTLLDGDSNALWLDYLVAQGHAPAAALAEQAAFYAAYEAGELDIDAYLRFHLGLLSTQTLSAWHPIRAAFVSRQIAPRISPAARAAVDAHRRQGDLMAVVTATKRGCQIWV